ncbi:MAG: hypothetical protein Kow00104_13440 [Rhodothalassiaceae bacterium]
MRQIAILLIVLCLGAGETRAGEFIALYKSYKAALESGDGEATKAAAAAAYEAAKAEYPDGEYRAIAAFNYGQTLSRMDDLAIALFQESADIFEAIHGKTDPSLIDPLWELGKRLVVNLDYEGALVCYDRIEAVLAANDLEDPLLVFDLMTDKSEAFFRSGNTRGAMRLLDRAKELLPDLAPNEAFHAARLDLQRGKYYRAMEKNDKAIEAFASAADGFERSLPADHQLLLGTRTFLVISLEEEGRGDEATANLLKIAAAHNGEDDKEYLPLYRPQPIYPSRAQELGIEGHVIVSLTVGEDGRTSDVTVVESSNDYFIEPSIAAARNFRYAPRMVNGRPVRSEGVRYIFTYSLTN